jgi:hypothetical protein
VQKPFCDADVAESTITWHSTVKTDQDWFPGFYECYILLKLRGKKKVHGKLTDKIPKGSENNVGGI